MKPLRRCEIEPSMIRGSVEIETTGRGLLPHRLPRWARRQIPDRFLVQTSAESAGVRLALRTAADVVELDVQARRLASDAVTPFPPSVYELTDDGVVVATAGAVAGSRFVFTFADPSGEIVSGPDATVRFEGLATGAERDLELWLPYHDHVELLGLRADAPVAAAPASRAVRWVHHGSSISHGYRAVTTTGTWPVVAANRAEVALTNLSFSGNAMLDPFTARTIRDTPADVITLKVGVNLVSGDVMRVRAFRPAVDGFLDTIREGHPDTPIVLVSPIWCEPVESAAGPTIQDPNRDEEWSIAAGTEADTEKGKLSLRVIRAESAAIVERRRGDGDDRLGYLDGLRLYGEADAKRLPLPDNLHPGPEVQRLIGERFADEVLAGLPGAARARIVTGFLRDGDRVLLVHRSPQRRVLPDVWDLPGGHVEPGELPGVALARELREELGIDVAAPTEPPRWRIHGDAFDMRIWQVETRAGVPTNVAVDEHDAIAWFRADELHTLRLAHEGYLAMFTEALATREPTLNPPE